MVRVYCFHKRGLCSIHLTCEEFRMGDEYAEFFHYDGYYGGYVDAQPFRTLPNKDFRFVVRGLP